MFGDTSSVSVGNMYFSMITGYRYYFPRDLSVTVKKCLKSNCMSEEHQIAWTITTDGTSYFKYN